MEDLIYEDEKYYVYLQNKNICIFFKPTSDFICFKPKDIFKVIDLYYSVNRSIGINGVFNFIIEHNFISYKNILLSREYLFERLFKIIYKDKFKYCKSYLNRQSVHCIKYIARINNIID